MLYLASFLIGARFPTFEMYCIAIANLGFTVNGYVRWRPDTLFRTQAERDAQVARIEQLQRERAARRDAKRA